MLLSLSLLPLPLFLTPILAQNDVQSAPFQLIIHSPNATLNELPLTACHEGAAIEGLCALSDFNPSPTYSTYTFNTSDANLTFNASLGRPGYLTFLLPGGTVNESEPLGLYYNPTSNVNLALFYPTSAVATYVAFDVLDQLNIQGYVDDTTVPATVGDRAYYRWYICLSYYEGYQYHALNWVSGSYPPENPTCQKVMVTRKYIE